MATATISTESLTNLIRQHVDGLSYMLSGSEYKWMEREYNKDPEDISEENLFGHVRFEEQLQVVDGQDFTGIDMSEFKGTKISYSCIPVRFVRCNFSGLDLTDTFFAECEFVRCRLKGTAGID